MPILDGLETAFPNIWHRFRRAGVRFEKPKPRRRRFKFKRPSALVASLEAGLCPMGAGHTQTRVYKITGRNEDIAHCVCDTCGATWQEQAEMIPSLGTFAARIADELDRAEPVVNEELRLVVLHEEDADWLVEMFRSLIDAKKARAAGLHQFCRELASNIDSAERLPWDRGRVVVMTERDARDMAKGLRELATTE